MIIIKIPYGKFILKLIGKIENGRIVKKQCERMRRNCLHYHPEEHITNLQQLKWCDAGTRVWKQIHAYLRISIKKTFQISGRKDRIIKDLAFGQLAHYLE